MIFTNFDQLNKVWTGNNLHLWTIFGSRYDSESVEIFPLDDQWYFKYNGKEYVLLLDDSCPLFSTAKELYNYYFPENYEQYTP